MVVYPAKTYNYVIEIDGIDQLLVQNVEIPELSFEEVVHGAAGNVPNFKTAGKAVVGDLVLEKLIPANEADFSAYEWYAQVLSGEPALFTRQGLLKQMSPDTITPIRTFVFTEAWVKSIATNSLSKPDSDNLVETITLSIHQWRPQDTAVAATFRQYWEQFN